MNAPKILLTGSTGYVGGRLLRRLESEKFGVRCLVRSPESMTDSPALRTQVVKGDAQNRDDLRKAMDGIDTAFYLLHSMGSSNDFEEEDRTTAGLFGEVAAEMGVQRIIYLGGLGHADDLSPHLRSRQEVGSILRDSGVQTLEFQASIIIGSGSLSFELIRGLVRKLPIMITPRWVLTTAQPIAIDDVVDFLVAALSYTGTQSRVFEIGGADEVSYGDLMMEYARQSGLRRVMISVPFLSLRLSSLWLSLVTPVYARVGRKLIDSVRHETVVRDPAASEAFAIRPKGYKNAIADALMNDSREIVRTRWSEAIESVNNGRSWGGVKLGNRIIDSRYVSVRASASDAFTPIRRIGGSVGWYYGDWLWKLRGLIDLAVGGVGTRRGRSDQEHIAVGDTLDFWRVTDYEENHYMLLAAEMKLPGRAWLHFEVKPVGGRTQIRQTAIFDTAGLGGLLYWYVLYPIHRYVFSGMLRGIVQAIPGVSEPPARAATSKFLRDPVL